MKVDPKYSQSRMSPFDESALESLLLGNDHLRVLEIGSWLGAGSTKILARHASELICIDHWRGNENQEHKDILNNCDPHLIFKENTSQFGEKIQSIKIDSENISKLNFKDPFDFIFIDGDHRYTKTIKDIHNCLPLLKKGGIISGHDCEARYSQLIKGFTEAELEADHTNSPDFKFKHYHPGVIVAVGEIFGDNVELFSDSHNVINLSDGSVGYSTIWYKRTR